MNPIANSVMSSLIQLQSAFDPDALFRTAQAKAYKWGGQCLTVIGVIIIIYSFWLFFKGLKAPQGGGGYIIKFIIGLFIGCIVGFEGMQKIHSELSNANFNDFVNGFIVYFKMTPVANLPFHDVVHMMFMK